MEKKKLEWLSSVRGLAALLVVLRHIWPYFYAGREHIAPMRAAEFVITDIIDMGKVGVVIFFLISGYLLPKGMAGKTRREFVLNRVIRLYPAYWVSIFTAVIFVGGYSLKQVLVNLTMLQTFLFVPDVMGVYWTMPIEIVLYIGCLIFYKGLKENNLKLIHILYALIGAASLGIAFLRGFTGLKLPVAMCTLILTAFLGHYIRLYRDGDISLRMLSGSLAFFGVIMPVASFLAYNTDMGFDEKWYRYVLSYSLGVTLFLLFSSKGLGCRFLSKTGALSYSLYLMHRVVITFMCDKLMADKICPVWYLAAVIVIIFAVTVCVNYLIENKLTKFLNGRLKKAAVHERS